MPETINRNERNMKTNTTTKPQGQPPALGCDALVSLSFEVVAITEKKAGSVSYFETTLRYYMTDQTITMRGNPWLVGSKVDFFMAS